MDSVRLLFFLILSLLLVHIVDAQDGQLGFSWTTAGFVSTTTINACGSEIELELVTSVQHWQIEPNMHVPWNGGYEDADSISVTLNFSQPVTNLHLHVGDLDENIDGEPVEYLAELDPFPTGVGGVFGINGGIISSDNIEGQVENNESDWLYYNGIVQSNYTFNYHRPFPGAAIILYELTFDCPCEAAPTSFVLPEIQIFSGDANQVADNEIDACVGDEFCVSVAAVNETPDATVTISSDVETLFPDASFASFGGNAATAELCLVVTEDMVGTSVVTLTAGPTECPGFTGDQIELNLNVSPAVHLVSSDLIICSGESITAEAFGADSYTWIPIEGDLTPVTGTGSEQLLSPAITTTYVVSSPEASQQCEANDTLTIEVSLAELDIETVNESCVGGDGEITVDVLGDGGPYSLEWPDLNAEGSTVSDLEDGDYLLNVSDQTLADCSIDTLITVTGFQQANFELEAPLNVCVGQTVEVTFLVDGSAPFELNWSTNSVSEVNSNVVDVHTVTLTPTTSTTVCLEDLIDADGCVTLVDSCVTIEVFEQSVADFEWAPNPASSAFGQIEFTNLSSGADQFLWDFGAGGASLAVDPVISLDGLSVCAFQACLFANNDAGCADSICHVIPIVQDAPLYMPNVFTPNNDGVNELFLPVIADAQCIEELTFRVWNRWGEKIFETNTPGEGWNGSYKRGNHYVSDGTYIWEVIYRATGIPENGRMTGSVTVLR